MSVRSTLKHAPSTIFAMQHGELVIGGQSLSRLALRVGQTPFYAYDRQALSQRLANLRQHMPPELKIHYAIKANPMPAVVQHMATLMDGFDVASAGEMKLALDTPMPKEHISFAGPGKRATELRQAIAAGVTINAESMHELTTIAQQCDDVGLTAKVALRINPTFELKASGMKMGGSARQFGIDEHDIPTALQHLKDLGLSFQGFHIYNGSQNLKADAIIEAQHKSLYLAATLTKYCPSPILKLNIGGGFGIPYFPGDQPVDIARIGDELAKGIAAVQEDLAESEIIIELGRYLVGEAGIYVTRIIDKKISYGETFLIVDGGLHHHLAASGNFGQIIRKNYPVAIGNQLDRLELETVNIVGSLCTPLDTLAEKMVLPKADIGDLVVIYQSGAYGYTASPARFLSQPEAIEVLV